MVLSFNQNFPEKILNGTKIHTLREDQHNRWKAGRSIQMSILVRTSKQRKFADKECTGVQTINILYVNNRGEVHFIIDGNKLLGIWHRFIPEKSVNPEAIEVLARNDGFESVEGFLKWFVRDFEGKIVHWTEFRY